MKNFSIKLTNEQFQVLVSMNKWEELEFFITNLVMFCRQRKVSISPRSNMVSTESMVTEDQSAKIENFIRVSDIIEVLLDGDKNDGISTDVEK
jgi:hypothetical protein